MQLPFGSRGSWGVRGIVAALAVGSVAVFARQRSHAQSVSLRPAVLESPSRTFRVDREGFELTECARGCVTLARFETAAAGREGEDGVERAVAPETRDGTVVLAHGAVREELRGQQRGVEQSWRWAAKPAGRGDLTVRVAVTGARFAARDEGGLHFASVANGVGISYGNATWVDALGRRTDVPAQWSGGEVVMTVPARVVDEAAFPAVLDPTVGPEIGTNPFADSVPGPGPEPTVSCGDTLCLVVWRGTHLTGVRIDPATLQILDPGGIPILPDNYGVSDRGVLPAVGCAGTRCVLATPKDSSGGIIGTRFDLATGAVLDNPPVVIESYGAVDSLPAVACGATQCLIDWYALGSTSGGFVHTVQLREKRIDPATGAVDARVGSQPLRTANWPSDPAYIACGDSACVIKDTTGSDFGFDLNSGAWGATFVPPSCGASVYLPAIACAGSVCTYAAACTRPTTEVRVWQFDPLTGVIANPAGTSLVPGVTSIASSPQGFACDGTRCLLEFTPGYPADALAVFDATSDALLASAPRSTTAVTYLQGTAIAGGHAIVVGMGRQSPGGFPFDARAMQVDTSTAVASPAAGVTVSNTVLPQDFGGLSCGDSACLLGWSHVANTRMRYYGRVDPASPAIEDADGIAFNAPGVATSDKAQRISCGDSACAVNWIEAGASRGSIESVDLASGTATAPVAVPYPEGYVLGCGATECLVVAATASAPFELDAVRFDLAGGAFVDGTGFTVAAEPGATTNAYAASVACNGDDCVVFWQYGAATSTGAHATHVQLSTGISRDNVASSVGGTGGYSSIACGPGRCLAVWNTTGATSSSLDGNRGGRFDLTTGTPLDPGGVMLEATLGRVQPACDGARCVVLSAVVPPSSSTAPAQALGRDVDLATGTFGPLQTLMSLPKQEFAGDLGAAVDRAGHFVMAYTRFDATLQAQRVKLRQIDPLTDAQPCATGSDCASGVCSQGVCYVVPPVDAGSADAAITDASAVDATDTDATVADAADTDANAADATTADTSVADAADTDANAADATTADVALADVAVTDAGAVDATNADASVADVGMMFADAVDSPATDARVPADVASDVAAADVVGPRDVSVITDAPAAVDASGDASGGSSHGGCSARPGSSRAESLWPFGLAALGLVRRRRRRAH